MLSPNESLGTDTEPASSEETARLRALRRYEIVETPPETEFDRLADLATGLADTPIGLISFVEADRQWHKAAVGTDVAAIERPHSFCTYALETPGPTVVEDLRRHERFADNPYVGPESDAAFCSYAGVPITTRDGHPLGTVCVLDRAPRSFGDDTLRQLRHLADQALEALDRRLASAPAADIDSVSSAAASDPASDTAPHYRAALKHSPVIFAEVDRDLRYKWIYNPPKGFDPEAAHGKRTDELYSGPGIDRLMALQRRTLDRGEQMRAEITFDRSERTFTCDVTVTPLRGQSGGDITGLSIAALDVTERKQRAEELRHTRDQLRHTQEVAEVGGWEYDPQTHAFECTEQLYRLLDLPPDTELDREDALRIHPPEARRRVAAAVNRCVTEGKPFDLEVPFLLDSGERRWARTQGEARIEDGTVVRVVGTLQDVTEQKRQERVLSRQNDLFEKAQHIAQVGAWEYDLEHNEHVLTNQAYAIHGLPPTASLTPEDSIGMYHPEDRPELRDAFNQAVEQGTPYNLELRLNGADGHQRWVRTRAEPQTADGDVVRLRGTIQNITERKEMERTLRSQKELLSSVTENIFDGIYRSTPEDGIVYANQAFLDMFGYNSLEELAKVPPAELYVNPDTRESLYKRDDRNRAEVRFRRKDGSTFVGLVNLRKITDEDGKPLYYDGAITDITDRRRREEQLRSRQEKVEALYEASSRLLRAEGETEVADLLVTLIGETLGYSGTTIRFAKGDKLEPSHVPNMVRRYMPQRPSYDLNGDTPAAKVYRTGETQVFDDLASDYPSLNRGDIRATAYVPMESYGLISVGSLEVGGISPFDLRLIEVLAAYAALVLGRLDREDTLRAAKEEAEEANRMKSVLLSNINHEFRTPLTSIISFSKLIQESPEVAETFGDRILDSGERLLHTLNTVMDFAELEGGQASLTPKEFDLRSVVHSVADDFRESIKRKDLSLSIDRPADPIRVVLDRHYVKRICTHLMSNAVKFTEEGDGEITVGVRSDDSTVHLWVDDPGIGIAPSFLPNVYDEFTQSSSGNDRTHEGNGLGLTITKRLVDGMDGSIDIDSTPGEGTCVTVRLPRLQSNDT